MSETYNILCEQCRVSLWVGQSAANDPHSFHIYGGNHAFPKEGEVHSPLAEFLFHHSEHLLRFKSLNQLNDDDLIFTDLQDKPGLPPDPDQITD